jgi:GntR family transcriptional regulator
MIGFQIDAGSGVATYPQLGQQVRQAPRLRLPRPGDQLPTAREVVSQLAINPDTVLKAYRELEREGLVAARPGQGTFVLRTLAGGDVAAQARLRGDLGRWLAAVTSAGLTKEDADALYQAAVCDRFGRQAEPAVVA